MLGILALFDPQRLLCERAKRRYALGGLHLVALGNVHDICGESAQNDKVLHVLVGQKGRIAAGIPGGHRSAPKPPARAD